MSSYRKRRSRRRNRRRSLWLPIFLSVGLGVSITVAAVQWYIENLPRPGQMQTIAQTSYLHLERGRLLAIFPTPIDRRPMLLAGMDPLLVKGSVAVEDKRYWQHEGYDLIGLARASVKTAQGSTQGGSTITQQVVRNLYPDIGREQTVERKLRELYTAQILETNWNKDFGETQTKQKILSLYLNNVYVGNGAYGMQAGARRYFHQNAASLTPAQAALLIGLIRSPSGDDPFRFPQRALVRRNFVLQVWYEQGLIDKQAMTRAQQEKVPAKTVRSQQLSPVWQDVSQAIEDELVGRFSHETLQTTGVHVYTTVDPRIQRSAQRALQKHLSGRSMPVGAMVIIENKTGAVRAIASSRPGLDFSLPRQAKRQPGSSAKVWALAALVGEGYDLDKINYTSRPLKIVLPRGEIWNPQTFDHAYPGWMSLERATVRSDNSVYAQLTLDLTPQAIARWAQKAGINRRLRSPYAIGLGSVEVTPLEQANFYATIARGGEVIAPHTVHHVTDARGKVVFKSPTQKKRVLSSEGTAIIQRYLKENVDEGTATRAGIPRYYVAGKTGTTDDFKDAWFCGFTVRYTACVWVGYLKPKPMNISPWGNVSGGTIPATVWHDAMRSILPQADKDKRPTLLSDDPKWPGRETFNAGGWQNDDDYYLFK